METTLSICLLPVGGVAGSVNIFPDILQKARKVLKEAEGPLLSDSFVTHAADRLIFLMVHQKGSGSKEIVELKDQVILEVVKLSEKYHLFKQQEEPILLGLSFEERTTEQFVLFLATHPGKKFWNDLLLTAYANPFCTDSVAKGNGFLFCMEGCEVYQTPRDLHRLCIAADKSRVAGVAALENTPAASACGNVMISRTEGVFPKVAELCDAVSMIKISDGYALSPVSLCDSVNASSKIAMVIALGFSLYEGRLIGPLDLFDNPAFEAARVSAGKISRLL